MILKQYMYGVFQLGWEKNINNYLDLVEGEIINNSRNVNGIVVFSKIDKYGENDRSSRIMVFGMGVKISNYSELREYRIESKSKKNILVFGEDNSLKFQICE